MVAQSRRLRLQMTGLNETIRALGVKPRQILPAIGQAMYEEASQIAELADLLVPYDSGDLARSQIVHLPVMRTDSVLVEITYGGPAAPYAVVQHENLDFSHPSKASGLPPNGRQAKYLEEPFEDRVTDPRFEAELAMRVEESILRALIEAEGRNGAAG